MDDAFEPNRPDVRAMRKRAERQARRGIRFGLLALVLSLPVAIEAFATPFITLAAVLILFACSNLDAAMYHQGRKRFLLAAASIAVAEIAWVPRLIEDADVSLWLFAGPIALIPLSWASLNARAARLAVDTAMQTEAKRAKIREQRQQQDARGKSHGVPDSLTLAEIKAHAAETGGRATVAATPWRGTPDGVSLADERHPKGSPAERLLRKDLGDQGGSMPPGPQAGPTGD